MRRGGTGSVGLALVVGAMLVWLMSGLGAALAAPGDLDPAFGDGGVVRVDVNPHAGNASDDVAIDESGRIVVLATAKDGSGSLLRFAPDGALDLSFGSSGTASLPGGPWQELALQPDGQIVAAGSVDGDFALARFDPQGALDPAFGEGGIATFHVAPTWPLREKESLREQLGEIAIQQDGRIVAAGNGIRCYGECGVGDPVVVRYRTDGSMDPSFGMGGVVAGNSLGSSRPLGRIDSLVLDPRGRVLLGGAAEGNLAVARLDTDGSLDPSFSGDGVFVSTRDTVVEEEIGTYGDARLLVVQPSGRIVVVGELIVLGLRPNGTRDRTFGRDGSSPATVGRWGASFHAEDALADEKGRVLLAGGAGGHTAVLRLFRNGVFDPRFGGDGTVQLDLSSEERPRSNSIERATGIARLTSGSLLSVGFALTRERRWLVLAALRNGDGHRARCHGQPVRLQGTPGDDALEGLGPIAAFGGDDRIASYGGPICAGAGDDFIHRSSSKSIYAGPGDDKVVWYGPARVFGGAGDDTLRAVRGDESGDFAAGGPGRDEMVGGRGPDELLGGPGDDRIFGGGGKDTLRGGRGGDLLIGGPDTDLLLDARGENTLLSGPDGPPVTVYRASRRGFRIRLAVRGRRVTGLHLTVRLHCGKHAPSTTSSTNTNHFGLPIDAAGRFRYSVSERDLEENDYEEYLAGRIRPGSIVGSYREADDFERVHCATGRPGHRLLRFRARRL